MARVLALAVLTLLVAAPSATAYERDGLAIADQVWGPHRCSGKVRAVYHDDILVQVDGRVVSRDGVVHPVWTGTEWSWSVSCTIEVRRGLITRRDCQVKVHEVGHLVHGPSHDGPMSAERMNWAACDPTRLELMVDEIRERLPQPARWTIRCRRARCTARAPGARTRRYRYAYDGNYGRRWWALPSGDSRQVVARSRSS
jgi:hypothetical protein